MPSIQWDYNEYVWPFLLSVLIAVALLPYAWPRRDVPASLPFLGVIVSAGLWSLLSCLQVLAVGLAPKVLLANLRYVPITLLPVAWLAFALAYAGGRRYRTAGKIAALFVVPLVTLALVATNPLHGLMFKETALATIGPVPGVARTYGLWFWVHTTYSYGLLAAGAGLVVYQRLYGPTLYRSQATFLLAGVFAPVLMNLVFLAAPSRFGHIDLTPVGFIVSSVFFVWAVFPFRRLDLRLVARAATVEDLPDAVVVLDAQNRVVDLNPSARLIFGEASAKAIGRPVAERLPELAGVWPVRAASGAPSEVEVKEMVLIVRGARRSFDVRASPVDHRFARGPEQVVVVLRDITEQKQTEAERERLIAELEAKNTELERFTYTVSHDLKSPLVTIKGFLGLLRKDAAQGNAERMEADIQQVSQAADKMQRLLGELLELSRIGRVVNPFERVALTELAREAVGLVAGQIKARGVTVEIEPEMPVVFGDRVRLLEVYQNLIDNAVKFMGHQPEPLVEIGIAQREGDEVFYFVRDNGLGIASRYHEKIFGLFERLGTQREGTGVGLALVKRIVEVHGGRIWVESEGEGKGSTFYFTLSDRGEAVDETG